MANPIFAPIVALAAVFLLPACGSYNLHPGEVRLAPAGNTRFVEVATGTGQMVCARTAGGRVGCFDWHDVGAFASNGEAGPNGFRWMGDIEHATQLSVGDEYGCALTEGGSLRCFGILPEALRASPIGGSPSSSIELSGELGPAIQLSAGREHLCLALASGAVACAGNNSKAQLGDGSAQKRNGWVRVEGVTGARQVAVGESHSCALVDGAQVQCWGDNSGGQLGDGTTTDARQPVYVEGVAEVQTLIAGAQHTCGITGQRRLICWGHNQSGQRGLGDTAWQEKPTEVPMSGPVDLASSAQDQLCAAVGGQVSCWGSNSSDWFMDGDYIERSRAAATPTRLPALDSAIHLSSSYGRACAIVSNGGLRCEGPFDLY